MLFRSGASPWYRGSDHLGHAEEVGPPPSTASAARSRTGLRPVAGTRAGDPVPPSDTHCTQIDAAPARLLGGTSKFGAELDSLSDFVSFGAGRLARRFGWTTQEDPEKVEADLMALFPRRNWTTMSHRVIWHGRRRCHARTPACGACPVARWCPSFGEGPTDPERAARLVKDSGRA